MANPNATPSTRQRGGRRYAAVMLLGFAVFGVGAAGVSAASAAGLGGLMSSDFGSDNRGVVSCDADGVSIVYSTEYEVASHRYLVTGVTLGGLAPACAGKTLQVTLANSVGGSLSTGAAVAGGTSQTVTMAPGADANLVTDAAVVITG